MCGTALATGLAGCFDSTSEDGTGQVSDTTESAAGTDESNVPTDGPLTTLADSEPYRMHLGR